MITKKGREAAADIKTLVPKMIHRDELGDVCLPWRETIDHVWGKRKTMPLVKAWREIFDYVEKELKKQVKEEGDHYGESANERRHRLIAYMFEAFEDAQGRISKMLEDKFDRNPKLADQYADKYKVESSFSEDIACAMWHVIEYGSKKGLTVPDIKRLFD